MSFKLDPQAIPDLPAPRPQFEIWVYSPRVEGVHLRFGRSPAAACAGPTAARTSAPRSSGLVKAQMVKNAVIVPVGAKGGFVAKQLPDPSVDRDAWLAEGIACYQTFISGLLDITDNLRRRARSCRRKDVVRHDGDDPYLVVAADKGTATFSDIANEIADRATASGSATRSPPAARSATTTRRWASPPGAPGSR